MTQIAPPPASVPAVAPDPLASTEVVVHRLTLRSIPWSLYEQLLAAVGDGLPRMTYDRGTLEMEMPSRRHEALKFIAAQFIAAYAGESGIRYEAAGSTTWRQEAVEGGLEADESYYIQNSSGLPGGSPTRRRTRRPIWRSRSTSARPTWRRRASTPGSACRRSGAGADGRLTVLCREPSGDYGERQRSVALPDFPLDELAAALAGYPQVGTSQAVADFDRHLRERPRRT